MSFCFLQTNTKTVLWIPNDSTEETSSTVTQNNPRGFVVIFSYHPGFILSQECVAAGTAETFRGHLRQGLKT